MNALKKILPVVIAFALGVIITYLFMNLNTNFEMFKQEAQSQESRMKLEAEILHLRKQLNPKDEGEEEKHWFDERIDQKAAETEKQTKKQQSQGDDMKSQFDQFGD